MEISQGLQDLDERLLEQAWARVRDNEGSFGVDGVSVWQFEKQVPSLLPELLGQLQDGSYFGLPLRKVQIEKKPGSGQYRTLLIPCVRDRVVQTAVARLLNREWEDSFLESSYAYRHGRGVNLAIQEIIRYRDAGYGWVLDADISAYFDSISHTALERKLSGSGIGAGLQRLIREWVKSPVWNGHELQPMKRGIAQGSPLSPIVANFFLSEFDLDLAEGQGRLVRYADDFIVLAKTREVAEGALKKAKEWLEKEGLHLHPGKTSIVSFEEGFRYLGVQFRAREVMIPWRPTAPTGRIVSAARKMPQAELRRYRKAHTKSEPKAVKARAGRPAVARREKGAETMPVLYVTQPGSVLRKSGERLIVESEDHVVLDVPARQVESVLLFGNVQITTQALSEALDHSIPVSFHTRHGRFRGKVSDGLNRNVLLRMAQYRRHEDAAWSLGMARRSVASKIANGIEVLERYEERETETDLTRAARGVMREQHQLVESAADLEAVMGHEGAAAAQFFEGLMRFQKGPFEWKGRKKHPAPDPLNGLLSFGYTLLMQELLAAIEVADLDSGIGFLHQIESNRPSLALDLMEPFRHPVVDRLVLSMVNRQMFRVDDFAEVEEGEGVHLKPDSLRRFLEEYEKWMLGPVAKVEGAPMLRSLIRKEIAAYVEVLRDEAEWRPFAFPWKGQKD